jgi:hypothetical protein
MQAFDTIKFQLSPVAIRGLNQAAFDETIRTDGLTGQTEQYWQGRSSALPVGVSSIKYRVGDDFQITISAKTLKDNYLQGISLNTWEQAITAIAPVLDIDPELSMQGKVYLCDSTNNILKSSLEGASTYEVCQALLAGRANLRFNPKFYHSKKKLGVEFHGTQQEKNRIICYDKQLDLLKPENKLFMKALKGGGSPMLMAADKVVRFETNHTAFRSMRQRFGVAENTIHQLLHSTKPVNHDFLCKVLNMTEGAQSQLFEQVKDYQGRGLDFIYLKGIENIILELNCNDVQVKEFFKLLLGDNFKYQYYRRNNNIRQILARLKATETGAEQVQVKGLCGLVLDALKVAV